MGDGTNVLQRRLWRGSVYAAAGAWFVFPLSSVLGWLMGTPFHAGWIAALIWPCVFGVTYLLAYAVAHFRDFLASVLGPQCKERLGSDLFFKLHNLNATLVLLAVTAGGCAMSVVMLVKVACGKASNFGPTP